MSVTPAGPISVAIDGLRTLIANIPFFQTWTNTTATTGLNQIFTGEAGWSIASFAIAGGVLTVATREPHGISANQVITLVGASIGAESIANLDGVQTAVSVPSTTTITITTLLADLATQYPDQAFILPAARPIAVICEPEDSLKSESVGTGGASIFSGEVEILLEADVSSQYHFDAVNALYEARNAVGQFVAGLMLTQGTGDLMCLNRAPSVSGPTFTAQDLQDDNAPRFERWRALIKISWGMEG
jgi:hypothetical protein